MIFLDIIILLSRFGLQQIHLACLIYTDILIYGSVVADTETDEKFWKFNQSKGV